MRLAKGEPEMAIKKSAVNMTVRHPSFVFDLQGIAHKYKEHDQHRLKKTKQVSHPKTDQVKKYLAHYTLKKS